MISDFENGYCSYEQVNNAIKNFTESQNRVQNTVSTTQAAITGALEGLTEWDRTQTARTIDAWSNSDIGALARGDFKTFWGIQKNSSAAELVQGNFGEAAKKFGEENKALSTALGFETAKDGYKVAYNKVEKAVDDGDDTNLSAAERTVAAVGGLGNFADEMLTPVGLASLPVFNGLIKGGNFVLGKLPSFVGKGTSIGLVADGSRRVGNGVYDIATADTKEEVKEGTGKVIGGAFEAGIGFNVGQKVMAAEAIKTKTTEIDTLKEGLKAHPETQQLAQRLKDAVTKEDLSAIRKEVGKAFHPDRPTGNKEIFQELSGLIDKAEKNLPKVDTSSGITQKVKDGFSTLKDKAKSMFAKKPQAQEGALVKSEASITPKVDTPATPVKAVVTPNETVIKSSETVNTTAVEPKNTAVSENPFEKPVETPYAEAAAADTATVLKDTKPVTETISAPTDSKSGLVPTEGKPSEVSAPKEVSADKPAATDAAATEVKPIEVKPTESEASKTESKAEVKPEETSSNPFASEPKMISKEEFLKRVNSDGYIHYEKFIDECLDPKTQTVREDIVQVIERNYELGIKNEDMTKSLVIAYKENPQRAAKARNTLTVLDHLNQRVSDIAGVDDNGNAKKTLDLTIKMWDRNPQKDIFQGNYSTCCIGMGGGNGSAMPHYIMNGAYNMIEIVDNRTGRTIGNALCYFVKGADGKPAFIIDNIEINNAVKPSAEIGTQLRNSITEYASKVAKEVTGKDDVPVYMSGSYNDVPCSDLPKHTERVSFMGDIDCDQIYMDLYDGWVENNELTQRVNLLKLK